MPLTLRAGGRAGGAARAGRPLPPDFLDRPHQDIRGDGQCAGHRRDGDRQGIDTTPCLEGRRGDNGESGKGCQPGSSSDPRVQRVSHPAMSSKRQADADWRIGGGSGQESHGTGDYCVASGGIRSRGTSSRPPRLSNRAAGSSELATPAPRHSPAGAMPTANPRNSCCPDWLRPAAPPAPASSPRCWSPVPRSPSRSAPPCSRSS